MELKVGVYLFIATGEDVNSDQVKAAASQVAEELFNLNEGLEKVTFVHGTEPTAPELYSLKPERVTVTRAAFTNAPARRRRRSRAEIEADRAASATPNNTPNEP